MILYINNIDQILNKYINLNIFLSLRFKINKNKDNIRVEIQSLIF